MLRYWRWLFTTLAATSLLACLLICLTFGFFVRDLNRMAPQPLGNRLRNTYLYGSLSAAHAIELSILLPVIWLALTIRRYLRRETPPGHCRYCGYNLTGNVSGICPECGTAIAANPQPGN